MGWVRHHVNFHFMLNLRAEYGTQAFTNADAYMVYERDHAEKHGQDAYWRKMSVRNSLCAAVALGLCCISRLSPGVYRFRM